MSHKKRWWMVIMRLSEELEACDSERRWLGTICTSPTAYLSLENDAQPLVH